jgi:hypothetical protein
MKCWERLAPLDNEIGGSVMREQTYKGQTFLEYANEAAGKIRKAHQILSGGESIPDEHSLLGKAYYSIVDMVQEYLAAIGLRIADDDDFINMAIEITFCEKDMIESIIKEYCKLSA